MKLIHKIAGALLVTGMISGAGAQDKELSAAGKGPSGAPVEVSFGISGNEQVSGVQFDISYDSSKFEPNLENCLAGVPETHRGEFSVCNAIPSKNVIRVIVMDLGNNRLLPTGPLGTVRFSTKDPSATAPSVQNVLLAGSDGKPAGVSVESAFDSSVQRN